MVHWVCLFVDKKLKKTVLCTRSDPHTFLHSTVKSTPCLVVGPFADEADSFCLQWRQDSRGVLNRIIHGSIKAKFYSGNGLQIWGDELLLQDMCRIEKSYARPRVNNRLIKRHEDKVESASLTLVLAVHPMSQLQTTSAHHGDTSP